MSTDRPRQLWLLPVLLITVIATAVGGLFVRTLYQDPGQDTPAAVESPTVTPSKQPGSPTVQGARDARQSPLYDTARSLLQRYFDAINDKDYESWQSTVMEQRVQSQPREKWESDFHSTKDGSIVILRIELGESDTARVLMTFTSTQNREDAPPKFRKDCIHWNVVYPLILQGDEWKIDSSPASRNPHKEECPKPGR